MRTISRLVLALAFLAGGCAKDEKGAAAPDAEETSGGEMTSAYEPKRPSDAGSRGAGEDPAEEQGAHDSPEPASPAAEDPASAWGQTKSEQCAPPPRPPISPEARDAIAQGARAAREGRVADARAHFERSIAKDARAYPAHHNLGVLADREGREGEALDYYRRARAIAPDYTPAIRGGSTIALRRGSVPDALALVAPLAQQYRTNLDLQALHAELLVRAKRYDDAWAVGRRALECDERHVPTLKAIIRASFAQGRDDLAESVLAQALAIRDSDAELHFIQGQLLESKPGRVREAIEEFRKAVSLRPNYAEARMALGKLELSAGNYGEAVAHFEAVDRVVPGSIEVKLNLADAYRSSRRWEDAQRMFDEVLKMNANLPAAHFNLGLMYQTPGFSLPGVDELVALQKAKQAFTTYRTLMGSKLKRGDTSEEYLAAVNRRMQRMEEARRRQAEEARQKEAEREGGAAAPAQEDDDAIFFD
jgi:tetratricopeptide (TPR) repeat protein